MYALAMFRMTEAQWVIDRPDRWRVIRTATWAGKINSVLWV